MAANLNTSADLIVGLDFSKAISQDAPRAAAQIEKIFNSAGRFQNFTGPLGKISSSTNEFTKSLEAANARVIAFGASVGIVYNIQKAFEKLVTSTISVEKALTDISTISNQSSKEIVKFGSELFKIGNQTGQTFDNVSKAALEFSRQGLTVAETLKRTKDALILTRISGLDAKDAVETLTAAVNSFGEGLLTTTQLVNKFVAVDTSFAVSSKDLAEAISRVGATANDSKVSLDELLGVVTAVQQSTARGGAVIGNAFKTIFTRLQRADTIEQLRELGVEINNTQTGIEKLKALSAAVKTADTTTAAKIKELAAGVFQVNILSAALDDLSKSYGVYESAQRTSSNATDEAIRNNEKLNKSLSALFNATQNNITETFANIGKQSLNSPFRSILQIFNEGLSLINSNGLGDNIGADLGKGILTGFAKFLEGPGLLIAGNVVFRLFSSFTGFAKDAFKQLTNLSAANQERIASEKLIASILQSEPAYLSAILRGELSIKNAQDSILVDLKQRLIYHERIAALASSIAPGVLKAGISVTPNSIGRKPVKSGGHIPEADKLIERMGAYFGGYKPGNVKSTNLNGIGKVVYNDAEKIVNFPGMKQPAIIPPENSKAGRNYKKEFKNSHGFNPYDKGFVPNFLPIGMLKAYREVLGKIKDKNINFFGQEEASKVWGPLKDAAGFYSPKDQSINISKKLQGGSNWGERYDLGFTVAHEGVHNIIDLLSKPEYYSKLKDRGLKNGGIKTSLKWAGTSIYDKIIYGEKEPTFTSKRMANNPDLYPHPYSSFLEESLADNSLAIIKDRRTLGFSDKTSYNFRKLFERLNKVGRNLSSGFVPNFTKIKAAAYKTKKGNIFTGAYHGAAYEKIPQDEIFDIIDGFITDSGHFVNRKEAFLIAENASQLYKNDNVKKYSKLNNYKLDTAFLSLPQDNYFNSGLIPNFSAISDAISRESKSVPKSLIRIGQSSRLKSQDNPYGLGIYNLRDEPSGLNQGINRAYSEGLNPKSYGVPNFADTSFKLESKSLGGKVLERGLLPELNNLLNEIKSNNVSFDKLKPQVDKLIKEFNLTAKSASSVRGIFRTAEIKRPGTLVTASKIGLEAAEIAKQKELLKQGIRGFNQFAEPNKLGFNKIKGLLQNSPLNFIDREDQKYAEGPIQPKPKGLLYGPSNQNFIFGNQGTKLKKQTIPFTQFRFQDTLNSREYPYHYPFAQNLRQNSINDLIDSGRPDTRPTFYNVGKQKFDQSAQEYIKSKYQTPTSYDDLMGGGINKDRLKYAKRLDDITQKISTTSSFNIGGLLGQGKLFKEIENIKKNYSDLVDDSDVKRLKGIRTEKLSNVAFGASFAIPIVSETISQLLPKTEGGRQAGVGINALSSIASLGAAGFGLGGPVGGAIGLGVGTLSTIPSAIDDFTSSIPRLTKELERLQEQTNLTSQSLSSYISSSEKLASIYAGDIKASKDQIKTLEQEQRVGLINAPSQFKAQLKNKIESGDISGARELEYRINTLSNQQQTLLERRASIEKRFKTGTTQKFFNSFAPLDTIVSPENQGDISKNLLLKLNERIVQKQKGKALGLESISALTNISNSEGNNLISLLLGNKDKFAEIKSASPNKQLDLISEFAKGSGLKGFSEALTGFRELAKESPAELESFTKQFQLLLKDISDSNTSVEKANAAIKKNIEANRQIESSYVKIINGLDRFQSKLDLTFDINNIQRSGAFDRSQLGRENQLKIAGLTAGPLQDSRLSFGLNTENIKESTKNNLIKAEENFISEGSKSIISSYTSLLGSLTQEILDSNKGLAEDQKTKDANLLRNRINSIFATAGFNSEDFAGLTSGNITFDKTKINSVIGNLKKLDQNAFQGGLEEKQKTEIQKTLRDLIIKLENNSNEFNSSIIKLTESEKELLKTNEEKLKVNNEFINAQQKNTILQNAIKIQGEKELNNLRLINDIRSTTFKQNTELGGIGLNSLQRVGFEGNRNIESIRQDAKDSIAELFKTQTNQLKLGKSPRYANELGNISNIEDLRKLSEKPILQITDPEYADIINEAKVIYADIIKQTEKITDETDRQVQKQELINSFLEKQVKLKRAFSDDKANDDLKAIIERIQNGGKLTGKDISSTIRNELEYNNASLQRDAILGVSEVTRTMKQSFASATASIIKDGKDVGEALKEVLISVLNKITDRVTQMSTDILFNGLSSIGKSVIGANSGGLIKGYSTGGQVKGGSGQKDDVPAMLTAGEYVIRKDAVKKVGIKNLESLNYGNEREALLNLRNQFNYDNDKRPTKGVFDINSNLSSFGQTDTDIIRTNQLKFERENALYDYLGQKRDYELNKKNALIQFNNQKRNRRYGAYLNAVIAIGGAGINYGFSNSNAATKGVDFNGFQNAGITTAANGGIIQKYAKGGAVFGGNMSTDTIPALLTGGEYVIKKDRVNKIGIRNLDAINYGGINKFANGGLVGRQDNNFASNQDLFNSLVISINKLNDTLSSQNTNKQNINQTQNGINNYINVSISIDAKNNVASSSNVRNQSNSESNNRSDDKDRKNAEKLGRELQAKMEETILKETKQGGSIFTFVNSKL